MEIPSYTSNIQPYGLESGTKIASNNEKAQLDSILEEPQVSERINAQSVQSVEKLVEASKEREKLNRETRERLVEQMNDFISSINKGLSFRVDEASGRDVVTIYEADTGDIIRQIRDEEVLEIVRRLREQTARYSSGLLNQTV